MSEDVTKRASALIPDTATGNRGHDTRVESGEAPATQVTLESINAILMDYLTNTIKPMITDNTEVRPVPVQYAAGERWRTIRQEGVLRDVQGKLLCPLILLHRVGVKPSQPMNPNNKYLYSVQENRWNSRNVYDKFAVQNNINPSRSVKQILIPDYVQLRYEVYLWTDLQTQMDQLVEQISFENFEYWGQRNNFKFRVNIDDFPSETMLPASKDRTVRTKFNMNVEAYLLPDRVVKEGHLSPAQLQTYTAKKLVTVVEAIKNIHDLDVIPKNDPRLDESES